MVKMTVLLSLVLFSTSCAGSPAKQQVINKDTYYRHDLCFTYETGKVFKGKLKSFFERFKKRKYRKYKYTKETISFCGTGVLPNLPTYKLTVNSHAKINFFTMKSCHEEVTSENPNKGIFKKKDTYFLEYTPTIERGKACPLFFGAYSKRRKFGSGLIVFEDSEYQLPATIYCNGYTIESNGISLCHAREGLIQKIVFQEPVLLGEAVNGPLERLKWMGKCPPLELSKDGKSVKLYKMPPGECIYNFGGVNSKKLHKLYTSGYNGIILKE